MLNVAVIDDTLRLGVKLSQIINHNFNFNTKTYDYKQFHINKLITYKTDVLFMDISNTHNKSLGIIKSIRENFQTKKTAIIIITSNPIKEILIEAIKYGIIEILFKPYDYEKLTLLLQNIFEKVSKNKNMLLQEFLSKNKDVYTSEVNNESILEIQLIKRNYDLLIKDILRQEFRTKIKCNISFGYAAKSVTNEAVVYTAIYKNFENRKFKLSLVSTYDDILSIFSKNYNTKTNKFNYDILQICDEFSQSLFNRMLMILSNIIRGLKKIETNFAFYNSVNFSEAKGLTISFSTEMNNQFIFIFQRLEN